MKHIDPVELRGDVERDLIDYLDVWAATERISRMELVERLLVKSVEFEVHKANVIARMAKSKGKAGE